MARLIRCGSEEEVVRRGTDRVFALLKARPRIVLGMATGRTMVPFYAEWVRRFRSGGISFSLVRAFNLDEYVGAPPGHPGSFRAFLDAHLFRHVDIPLGNTHVLDGRAADLRAEGLRYEAAIREAGGIDLQLLGIGKNGHIGFNEPPSPLDSRTRVIDLAPSTLEPGSPSTRAITIGVGTILEAREILLLATGEHKAEAVRAMLEGSRSPDCPASALQGHPDTTVLVDPSAASLLSAPTR